jgi:hypothetical protein
VLDHSRRSCAEHMSYPTPTRSIREVNESDVLLDVLEAIMQMD